MQRFRPLQDKVLVKRKVLAEKTDGGIFIPESAQTRKKMLEGTVVEVGPGKTYNGGVTKPVGVKPGERVLFEPFVGTEVPDQKEHLLLEEKDLLAVIEA